MSYVSVGNLLASLVCDRVAIDMILKEQGVSENVREHVREIITGRIENVKENKLIIDDIMEDAPASRKDFKAGWDRATYVIDRFGMANSGLRYEEQFQAHYEGQEAPRL